MLGEVGGEGGEGGEGGGGGRRGGRSDLRRRLIKPGETNFQAFLNLRITLIKTGTRLKISGSQLLG